MIRQTLKAAEFQLFSSNGILICLLVTQSIDCLATGANGAAAGARAGAGGNGGAVSDMFELLANFESQLIAPVLLNSYQVGI